MPIDVAIDGALRLVTATPRGTLTHHDFVAYQKSVWTRPELAGFHEFIDMTKVEHVEFVSPEWLNELVQLSAGMDEPRTSTRMAVVAVSEFHIALARMYQTLRAEDPRSTRVVRIFPTAAEALAWLDLPPTSPPAAAS